MQRSGHSGEAGTSLIEIIIAIAILSVVLISLGALMFQVARLSYRSALAGYRSGAIATAGAWAQALPWDSIDTAVGCVTDTSGQLTYVRCTTVQTASPQMKTLSVVITPVGWETARPDTLRVTRTKPKPPSPLKAQ